MSDPAPIPPNEMQPAIDPRGDTPRLRMVFAPVMTKALAPMTHIKGQEAAEADSLRARIKEYENLRPTPPAVPAANGETPCGPYEGPDGEIVEAPGTGAVDGGGMVGKWSYQLKAMERRDEYRKRKRKEAGERCAAVFLARKALAETAILASVVQAAKRRME